MLRGLGSRTGDGGALLLQARAAGIRLRIRQRQQEVHPDGDRHQLRQKRYIASKRERHERQGTLVLHKSVPPCVGLTRCVCRTSQPL